jgi:predicted nucleic acid-binding protein
MKKVWGYGDFFSLLNKHENMRTGLIIDTNVLIAATYEFDNAHEEAYEFLSLAVEQEIPLHCNVNIRAEFLEIHRRIIFTEALLDFEDEMDKKKLPFELIKKLNSLRSQSEKRKKNTKPPLRLGEADIKTFKLLMSSVTYGTKDLWSSICQGVIIGKLGAVWSAAESELGLNFLSLRKEDQVRYFYESPEWEQVVQLVEGQGLSSSDAMIVNLFLKSKFEGIITSDLDVALAIDKLSKSRPSKIVFIPDKLAKNFN